MALRRFGLALFLITGLWVSSGCRLERREEFDFSVTQPLRCGIFHSYYFVREVQQEIYPDLGLVLANAHKLALTPGQSEALQTKARHCTELCEVRKDQLRLMQEDIKAKLALNEIRGNLALLSRDVRAFESAKRTWLLGHAERYRDGLNVLTEPQRAIWKQAEAYLKTLPQEYPGR